MIGTHKMLRTAGYGQLRESVRGGGRPPAMRPTGAVVWPADVIAGRDGTDGSGALAEGWMRNHPFRIPLELRG